MNVNFLPPPNMIGAPVRYDKWRHMQADAVWAAANSNKRFVIPGAPTGFGKSLMYVSTALLTDTRCVILTSTKALMRQLGGDFRESGMVEIKGLNAYPCVEGTPTGRFGDMRREGFRADRGLPMMCDEAPCQSGAICPKRGNGCEYYDAYKVANFSKLVVTNYAYWMSINKFGEGLGPVDLLVCDEVHEAIDELGSFVGSEIRPGEIELLLPAQARVLAPTATQEQWIAWGQTWLGWAAVELEKTKTLIRTSDVTKERLGFGVLRKAKDLKYLCHKLQGIATMSGEWIIEHTEDSQRRPLIKFDPIWPGDYAESNLFLGIPKVIMVSATVRPKTAEMLGVKFHDMDFKEYPSTFPIASRPVIYVPTAAMNMKSAAAGKRSWHARIDQIIARRLDRKGLIHTVSYSRAREVYLGSEYRDRMLIHDSTNTKEVMAQFKASKDPLILVSPVMDTGYDFPYEEAEYQIVAKMPFPVSVDKIMKARAAKDKTYRDYVTMIALVQMAGRIVRAEDDRGETFIIDSDFGWWYRFGHRLAPRWFNEAVREELSLGLPLPKLVRVA